MLFCLYNHSQQLEGRADGTSICPGNPIQEKGNYYKKGVEGDRKVKPLSHQRLQKKLLGSCRGPIFFGKLSLSQPDREEHLVKYCPYTKT